MAMILNENLRVFVLDGFGELSQEGGLSNTGHVFQTDFLGAGLNQLVGYLCVIFQSVDRRSGDAQCSLCGHAGFLGPLDGRNNIADVVQTVENTGDIGTLRVLNLVHQLTDIIRHRIHAERVQTAVEHVCLYAGLVERFAESTYGFVGILTGQKVYLLKGSTVGLNACKATISMKMGAIRSS